MTEWVAISPTRHVDACYQRMHGYGFTAGQSVVPVLLAELNRLIHHYALAFIRQGDDFVPVALLGDGQRNLYLLDDGRWLGTYVPAALRGRPFALAQREQDRILVIDKEHLCEVGGEPLFDDQGELAESVDKARHFLEERERNQQVTQQAARALNEAGVITSWPLEIRRGEEQDVVTVNDVYCIDEKGLNALEAPAYHTLRGAPMALAYAQLFSMSQLHQLADRARFHAKQSDEALPEDLDGLFAGDDEELSFDF